MSILILPGRFGAVKPTYQVELDRSHPLAPNYICLPLTEGNGIPQDLAGRFTWETYSGNPENQWGVGPWGAYMGNAAATDAIRTTQLVDIDTEAQDGTFLFLFSFGVHSLSNNGSMRPWGTDNNYEMRFVYNSGNDQFDPDNEFLQDSGRNSTAALDNVADRPYAYMTRYYSGGGSTTAREFKQYSEAGLIQYNPTEGTKNTVTVGPDNFYLGRSRSNSSAGLIGRIYGFFMWDWAVPAAEFDDLIVRPWQFFKRDPQRKYFVSSAAGGGTSIIAGAPDAKAHTDLAAVVQADVDTTIAANVPDAKTHVDYGAVVKLNISISAGAPDAKTTTDYPAVVKADVDTNISGGAPDAKNKTDYPAAVQADVDVNIAAGAPDAKTHTDQAASISLGAAISSNAPDAKTHTEYAANVKLDTAINAGAPDAKTHTDYPAGITLGGATSINASAPDAKTVTTYPANVKLDISIPASVDAGRSKTNLVAAVNAKTQINAAVAAKTITVYAANVSTGTAVGGVIMSTTLVYSAGGEASLPFSLGVSKDGGIVGLTATVAVRDGNTTSSYLDFDDLTFKTSAWVTKNKTLTEVGGGVYTGNVNIAGITNLPNNDLVLEYSVNGAVTEVAVSSIVFLKRLLQDSGALTVGQFLGLKDA